MKRAILLSCLITLPLSATVFACEKGFSPYPITPNQIVCVDNQIPLMGDPVKPSDEKPRQGQVPEWASGEVHVLPAVRAVDTNQSSNEQVSLPPNGGVPNP